MSARPPRRRRPQPLFAAAAAARVLPPLPGRRAAACARGQLAPPRPARTSANAARARIAARTGGNNSARDGSTGCYLQCVECGAVYAVEAEELDADSRAVQCALCRHEWLACERDLLWGAEHARPPARAATDAAAASAAPTPDVAGEGFHIFIGNLSFRANEQDLVRAFAAYGPVRTAQIPTDGTGASRGYGFVEMARKSDGLRAMRALQGVSVVGRDISLSEARPRRDPGPPREADGQQERREEAEEAALEAAVGRAPQAEAAKEERAGREERAGLRERDAGRERGRERGREGDLDRRRERSR